MTKGHETARSTIREARQEKGRVIVHWGDGHRSSFHPVWLRHARFFPAFPDRAIGSERFVRPDRVQAASVEVTGDGKLRVVWSAADDGTGSGGGTGSGDATDFEAGWLRDHCTTASERARRRRPLVRWDASISASPPRMSYETARGSDEGRLGLYRQVLDHGFTCLCGVPTRPGEVAEAAGLFGRVRPSPYASFGDDDRIEDVRVDPEVVLSTRLSHFLGPHTDTCWRLAVSGLVFLHCLKAHDAGGDTLLVDGFEVSERLREADPEAFALLARVPINFASRVNNGDEWRAQGRVITCDADGNVIGFRYNDKTIPRLELPEELIEPVYAALASLETILYDPALWLRRRLEPGEVLVLDNQRVLHGRTLFDPAAGKRHLQTCSVERVLFHNNYRRLARALGDADWNQALSWGVG